MSGPNLTNNMLQQQNIVLNQVPIQHTIMTNMNVNNGIPMASAMHGAPMDQGVVMDSMPVAQSGLVGVQQTVQNTPVKTIQQNMAPPPVQIGSQEGAQVLTKQRLQDVVRDIDPTLNLEDEVEELILNYVDEFVDRCLNGAALIAKNRHLNTIEVKDVQQFLNRNYNMWTPGFGTNELRPYKRSLTTESHKQRLALIRKQLKKY